MIRGGLGLVVTYKRLSHERALVYPIASWRDYGVNFHTVP